MRTWYHNITKLIFNESDRFDFIEEYDKGDVVYKSEDGCAILYIVEQKELDEIQREYDEENQDDDIEIPEFLERAFSDIAPLATGYIIPERCTCGNYMPTSTQGVIIDDCKNCGKKAPVTRMGI